MSNTSGPSNAPEIDKLDFDARRPLLGSQDGSERGPSLGREDGVLSDVVSEIIERDRKLMQREIVRVTSFIWGVLSAYGPRIQCLDVLRCPLIKVTVMIVSAPGA
jgi:crossover junction endonuclease EME1